MYTIRMLNKAESMGRVSDESPAGLGSRRVLCSTCKRVDGHSAPPVPGGAPVDAAKLRRCPGTLSRLVAEAAYATGRNYRSGARRRPLLEPRAFGQTCTALLLLAAQVPLAVPAQNPPPHDGFTVVATHPHDKEAFTQGLVFWNGRLYESLGLYGRSSVRMVELRSGQVLRQARLAKNLFGEGLTLWQGKLIQLTWKAQTGFVYDATTLKRTEAFSYPGEGWGITHDNKRWIVSDGSAQLRFFDPISRQQTGRVVVHDGGRPVKLLNELEYVEGEVWANIWHDDRVVRIAHPSGTVTGYIDLGSLWPTRNRPRASVLNGIAYDPDTKRVFVTGKFWPRVYELAFPMLSAPTTPFNKP